MLLFSAYLYMAADGEEATLKKKKNNVLWWCWKKISSIVVVSMNYFFFWRKHNRTNLPYKGSFGILSVCLEILLSLNSCSHRNIFLLCGRFIIYTPWLFFSLFPGCHMISTVSVHQSANQVIAGLVTNSISFSLYFVKKINWGGQYFHSPL